MGFKSGKKQTLSPFKEMPKNRKNIYTCDPGTAHFTRETRKKNTVLFPSNMTSKETSRTATHPAAEEPTPSETTPSSLDDRKLGKGGFRGNLRQARRSIQRYIWDDPDIPAERKWFLFKLDLFLLTSACLGYFSKNLDQSNISNAYVSGVRLAPPL